MFDLGQPERLEYRRHGIEDLHATGLTDEEARSLLLIGQPLLAHRLGLATPVRATREKLLNALPGPLATQAETLGDWFLHDPDPWQGNRLPHGELRRIAGAIQRRRVVELHFVDRSEAVEARPLGLVLKAGEWCLVAQGSSRPDVLGLAGLRSTRLTVRPFERPEDFDLATFWQAFVELRSS